MTIPAEASVAVDVPETKYLRLLGFPRGHQPCDRAHELMRWARSWYASHGRPWMDWREVPLDTLGETLLLDGHEFRSTQLRDHLRATGALRAVLVAVSAGPEAEAEAARLWEDGRPDEYFFLEAYASAVVEQLIAAVNSRLCATAARDGLLATPHLSPGYTGWDVSGQGMLFERITRDGARPLPGPLEVMASGMPRPKKSLLAVVGLAASTDAARAAARAAPCERCAFAPCQYRRAPYRHAPVRIDGAPAPLAPPESSPNPGYTMNPRALCKWAAERTRLEPQPDGTTVATFRFDGTTCSNMGRPLAFDYRVRLAPAARGRTILEAGCRPAEGDTGHRHMCGFLADAAGLMAAISSEKPLLGRPLAAVLEWERASAPAGCLCDAASRLHKWGLALEVIHFALSRAESRPPAASPAALSIQTT